MSQFMIDAQKFIEIDKANILKCYDCLLSKNILPSSLKLCKQSEELHVLWLNTHNLEMQGQTIQKNVLDIFMKYYKIAGESFSHNLNHELEQIKKRLLEAKLNPNLKKKLFELNIDQMLQQGQFANGQQAGHYSLLLKFIIHQKEVDYAKALENIKEILTLSSKWVPHFEKYVSQLVFSQD